MRGQIIIFDKATRFARRWEKNKERKKKTPSTINYNDLVYTRCPI
jgi:hypothetical protein